MSIRYMQFRTPTAAPTAKVKTAGWTLALASFLPILNVLLAKVGLPSIDVGDLDAAGGLLLGAYTSVVALVTFVRAYLKRPAAGDGAVPETL